MSEYTSEEAVQPVNTPTESKEEKAPDPDDLKKAKRVLAVIGFSIGENLKHIMYETKSLIETWWVIKPVFEPSSYP